MNIAFVLGNGRSRLSVDLDSLRQYGKIYGCNALYREFTPDVLVATDPEISEAIQKSRYALKNVFYTRRPLPDLGAKALHEHHYGYSSGPNAVSIALRDGAHKMFLLGFDLNGVDQKFNNVYADTEFYKKSNMPETYYGNWVNQISQIIRKKPCQVIRVNDTNVSPPEWDSIMRQVKMSDFIEAINNSKLEQL